jgi:hypothetical protein
LWRWYSDTVIEFLDTTHRLAIYLKTTFRRLDSCLRTGPKIGTNSIDFSQLSGLVPEDRDRVQSPKRRF